MHSSTALFMAIFATYSKSIYDPNLSSKEPLKYYIITSTVPVAPMTNQL